MKNNSINEYRRIFGNIRLSTASKHKIADNCAKYSTLNKINAGKFTVTAVKKEKSTDRA